jgi:hypothetical protein
MGNMKEQTMSYEDLKPNVQGRFLTTGAVILSYPFLFTPRAFRDDPGQAPKYNATALIDPSKPYMRATLDAAKLACEKAADTSSKFSKEQWKAWKAAGAFSWPIQDGNSKIDAAGYKNRWFIRASAAADRKPAVVDRYGRPLTDQLEIYPGCIVSMKLEFFGYNYMNMKRGVSTGLFSVQKLADGDRLDDRPEDWGNFPSVVDDDEHPSEDRARASSEPSWT